MWCKSKKEIEKVKKTVLNYFEYFIKERSLEKILPILSDNISGIGRGEDVFAKNKEEIITFLKRNIEQTPKPIEYNILEINIKKIKRSIFICNSILDIKILIEGIEFKSKVRTSFVISKKLGKLKIEHLHISIPYQFQKKGESFPIEAVKKEKEILEEMLKEKTKELEKTIKKLKEIDNIKNIIFAIMTHDIRTPFATALTFLDLIEKEDKKQIPDYHIIWQTIKTSFQNVLQLLETLIVWAKDQIEDKKQLEEKIDIKEIVKEVIDLYENEIKNKNINILMDLKPIPLKINRNTASIIIRNLIYNSIKYCNKNGTIKIKNRKINNIYFVSIKDNGIGINSEKLDSILFIEKNKSTLGTLKEKGSGLGLFLINSLLSKNNGKIKIKSKEGVGTVVGIFIKEDLKL